MEVPPKNKLGLIIQPYFLMLIEFSVLAYRLSNIRATSECHFPFYCVCGMPIYLLRRDIRIFVLGIMMLSILYIMYKSKMIKENMYNQRVQMTKPVVIVKLPHMTIPWVMFVV